MKKKVSLIMALIMLFGCFSTLCFPVGANDAITIVDTHADDTYKHSVQFVNSAKNPNFASVIDTVPDDDGYVFVKGWAATNTAKGVTIQGYAYTNNDGMNYTMLASSDVVIFNVAGLGSFVAPDLNNNTTDGFSVRINTANFDAGVQQTLKLYAVGSDGIYYYIATIRFTPKFFPVSTTLNDLIKPYIAYSVTAVEGAAWYRAASSTMGFGYEPYLAITDNNTYGMMYSLQGLGRVQYALSTNSNQEGVKGVIFTYITEGNADYAGTFNIVNGTTTVSRVKADLNNTNRNRVKAVGGDVNATESIGVSVLTYTGTVTASKIGLTGVYLLSIPYSEYAELEANLRNKFASAEASVGTAVKACDGLNFWAKDAASAQVKLGAVINNALNNENVAVSYANGVIANNKFTVDVTYTIEGVSYTDKVEIAISDKAVVGAQSKNNDDETYSVRFLATIDDYTAYDEIGFEIVADYEAGIYAETGKTYDAKCYEVFTSVLSLEDGHTVENSAGDFYGNYLMALTVDGIPVETGAAGFTVRAYYVVKGSTERIYTDTVSFDAVGGALVKN